MPRQRTAPATATAAGAVAAAQHRDAWAKAMAEGWPTMWGWSDFIEEKKKPQGDPPPPALHSWYQSTVQELKKLEAQNKS